MHILSQAEASSTCRYNELRAPNTIVFCALSANAAASGMNDGSVTGSIVREEAWHPGIQWYALLENQSDASVHRARRTLF
jgi:hypothetical protein